jgi:hypothetical protein
MTPAYDSFGTPHPTQLKYFQMLNHHETSHSRTYGNSPRINWDKIRIGYTPYSPSLDAPGDRRRFRFYASERKINFSIADPLEKYDIVYLTYGCDIGAWLRYKSKNPNVKIIFELIDSYLLEKTSKLTILRGITRYAIGKESRLWLNYKNALREIITISDAVVCSTNTQRESMSNLNSNIHLSLDYFENDITHRKNSVEITNKIKLVWEGQANTISNLLILNDTFKALGNTIELYIIADSLIGSKPIIPKQKTVDFLRKLNCHWHFIEWNKNSFSKHISNCDLAIIPISRNDPMMWNKPENKLIMMWQIGIATLTSNTPTYKGAMDAAGLKYYCASTSDWIQKIIAYSNLSNAQRVTDKKLADRYNFHFNCKYSIVANWDKIFASLRMN